MTQKTLIDGLLEALPRYYQHDDGYLAIGEFGTGQFVKLDDVKKALIEQAKADPAQTLHPDFNLEYTCKRIRRLLRLLNIPDPSPDKDDVLMACLFSLLGTACGIIERTQAKVEKPEPVGIVDKSIPTCEIQYTDAVGDDGLPDGTKLYTIPPDQSTRIAELESQRDRLLAEAKKLREWIADGKYSDDVGIYPNGATEKYVKVVTYFDALITEIEESK